MGYRVQLSSVPSRRRSAASSMPVLLPLPAIVSKLGIPDILSQISTLEGGAE